ncbi:hypothetical protein HNV12_19275 [Methanococcoides sp. SA1]|nr:hypothetical protein [Methanococcoides sp. SA1]
MRIDDIVDVFEVVEKKFELTGDIQYFNNELIWTWYSIGSPDIYLDFKLNDLKNNENYGRKEVGINIKLLNHIYINVGSEKFESIFNFCRFLYQKRKNKEFKIDERFKELYASYINGSLNEVEIRPNFCGLRVFKELYPEEHNSIIDFVDMSDKVNEVIVNSYKKMFLYFCDGFNLDLYPEIIILKPKQLTKLLINLVEIEKERKDRIKRKKYISNEELSRDLRLTYSFTYRYDDDIITYFKYKEIVKNLNEEEIKLFIKLTHKLNDHLESIYSNLLQIYSLDKNEQEQVDDIELAGNKNHKNTKLKGTEIQIKKLIIPDETKWSDIHLVFKYDESVGIKYFDKSKNIYIEIGEYSFTDFGLSDNRSRNKLKPKSQWYLLLDFARYDGIIGQGNDYVTSSEKSKYTKDDFSFLRKTLQKKFKISDEVIKYDKERKIFELLIGSIIDNRPKDFDPDTLF